MGNRLIILPEGWENFPSEEKNGLIMGLIGTVNGLITVLEELALNPTQESNTFFIDLALEQIDRIS